MARKVRDVERFEFTRDNTAKVAGYIDHLTEASSGWINLLPGISEEEEAKAQPTALSSLFGTGKPAVTMCTWLAPAADGKGHAHATLGISHFYGRRAVGRLLSLSIPVPSGWFVKQDHPRRGLVLEVPRDTPAISVVQWAITAGEALCHVPLTGMWRAEVYFPTT